MKKKGSHMIVIFSHLLLVGWFFVTNFNDEIKVEKYVSTIHNENLNKIAKSVSLLFEEEIVPVVKEIDETIIEELPSIEVIEDESEQEDEVIESDENESTPLVSVDASKYISKESMGFKVTENNKEYYLSEEQFNVVVAVVAGEYGGDLNDALAVVSVILNRCDSKSWSKWAGTSPYTQVIAKGQFEVYLKDYYLAYMPGGSKYGSTKYEVAKQAVIDGLNGIRNNSYMGFRAWYLTNYSNKYVTVGGNRYGYN
jgi:hypothetical protein